MGNPAKLQDGVPIIMKVLDLMPCKEAGGEGRKNTSNVPDCIQFATWNIGTMSGRSAEVVETLHKRKIDVCSVQETMWTGSGARVMGSGGVLEDMSLASRILEDNFYSPWPCG